MSESASEQPTTEPTFENKYKRALSLNDSWNLGEDLKELKAEK